VQIGENFYGPRALYTALRMKACDYVMPDFMRIGGVTGWQRARVARLGKSDLAAAL
jgi:mandelate racemase